VPPPHRVPPGAPGQQPRGCGEEPVGEQLTARDEVAPTLLYRRGNVLAGYTHLYFAEQDPFALFS